MTFENLANTRGLSFGNVMSVLTGSALHDFNCGRSSMVER
jgi:hypothetical protein